MDERYDSYCAVDPLFYDALTNTKARTTEYGEDLILPDGWKRAPQQDWTVVGPDEDPLPPQGWKVHISARREDAAEVLTIVWDYCTTRGIGFKFLRGPQMLLMRNSKYAGRGSSGKFITVYPHDDAELEQVCADLSALLAGREGPYILSDLRYGDGPVYVRYGGFAARYCLDDSGKVVPAIANATGTLVPDRRDPVFTVPEWVELPAFLRPHLEARGAAKVASVPYAIEKVLHFSNGGGLYTGRDTRTGDRVVLKEARPHAGLDATGADAVTRLRRERDMLRALADVPRVARVHDEFRLGDHDFLALDFIEGEPLNKALVRRYPLTGPDATDDDLRTFTDWALDVHAQVERVIREIHRRGIVYGDLHLFNVMVGPDDRITLLDFEAARDIAEDARPALRNQAFAAPRDRTGFAVDEYALACLRLALFLPLTAVLRLAPEKAAHFASIIRSRFPVPAEYTDDAVRVIRGDDAPPAPPITLDRDRIATGILATATPTREDRLFPGDIEQFRSGGLSLGYGAAGVLWTLHTCGAGRFPEHEQWLADRVAPPPSGSRLGLWDGLHGVAFALDALGRTGEARDLLDICLGEPWRDLNHDLVSGLAGVGLSLDRFGERAAADEVVSLLADRLDAAPPPADISGRSHPHAGLTRGWSGPAMLFLRRYETTRDPALLDLAARALDRDLHACVLTDDGAMHVNEGWRTMPYLAHGSAGIGIALDRYLRHAPSERFRDASDAISRAARSPFYAQSGLFAGRAGIVAYLASRVGAGIVADAPELARQAGALVWHALPYGDHLAFPGEQLLRLSTDVATGSAGVLLALTMARDPEGTALPLLAPTTTADAPAPRTAVPAGAPA
ncbi:class III lanthionine synthetase LanKC [Catenuloplanes atrovinosus]|uniref:Serine/threonine protein kinase n=1 Tax=Catenuloplanes atrovinosus TaxID=137266 RepID=A0AAE4CCA4_9ACTN|nr:class III lanthionine synthetase LanKC [Catenuloplanes atrovinosus]MDR7277769.1 serine/threonine protein kinase [Catenuloplanes atrovinosus]